MEKVLVSVIIPAYNCAGSIHLALDSALAQDVPMEILVINDCSPDDLDRVMEQYQNIPQICYLKNEQNMGVAATRNRGIALAKGTHIAFLDSDDYWEPDKLKKQLQQGQPLPHRTDYRNKTKGYFAGRILRFLLWGVAIFFFIGNLTGKTVLPLDGASPDFPFPTLQDLYPEAEVTLWDGYRDNEVTVWSDFLAPECYEYYESSHVTHPEQAPDTMWLTLLYFDTRWDWTARVIAKELTYQAGTSPLRQYLDELFGDEPIILTEMDIEGADYAAYYYRYQGYPYVVIQKGSLVIQANIDIFGDGIAFTPEEFAQTLISHLS